MANRMFIIVGCSDFASTLYTIITRRMHRKVKYFCVDDNYFEDGHTYIDCSVISYSMLKRLKKREDFSIVIGFVGGDMSNTREKKFYELQSLGFKLENLVDTTIDYPENIGKGNIIMQNVYIGYDTIIGDGNIFWPGGYFLITIK